MASNTLTHGEREMAILSRSCKDPEDRPLVEPFRYEILALCDKFGNSGQSGGSAPMTARFIAMAVEHICLQQPICPITGEDSEWVTPGPPWQNQRCGGIFKENGVCTYLDAIIWVEEDGGQFSGSVSTAARNGLCGLQVSSQQRIKSFPFTPKTFYVKVDSTEIAPDDWEHAVIEESDLDEVFEYYQEQAPTEEEPE